MKTTVITDTSGKILGTMGSPGKPAAGRSHEGPTASVQIVPGPGQKAIELDLPNDVMTGSAEEIHKAVTEYLKRK